MYKLKYFGKAYKGTKLKKSQVGLMPYFPEPNLIQAVEIARFLRRPLLLRGEPGCGKTRLAEALAYELYGDKYTDHFFKWFIKSNSKAQEGVYTFDHLKRLRDVQTSSFKPPENHEEDLKAYINYGPVGKAFRTSTKQAPSILLIDEIDKADIDFPNDLLNELEWQPGKCIEIPEANDHIQVDYPPIVIITSNDERELPHAFLRRCVFYYIEFPNKNDLLKIASAYLASIENNPLDNTQIKDLIDKFIQLRLDMEKKSVTDKIPSTSELLDWLYTHAYYELHDGMTPKFEKQLRFPGVVIKTESDLQTQLGKEINY